MNRDKELLILGSLLHDVGKIVYRGISERGNHSSLGGDFLDETLINTEESERKIIAEQARFHHAKKIAASNIKDNSLAYIT